MITEEMVEKILALDCRKEIDIRRLEKSLIKLLPFIKSEDDITTDKLEQFLKRIETKHMIHLCYVMRSVANCEDYYSGMIRSDIGKDQGRWLKTTYGLSFWEVLAKTLIYMYYYLESIKKPKRKGK